MYEKEKIISIVKARGPLLPIEISKEIETNILMASAMLGELVSKGEIKVSNVKVGSSPLYYAKGQEQSLQNFSDKLHEKERKAYELIKGKKILRDSVQEPVIRVALRQIKDFAKPLEVNQPDKKEIFWKWYLLSNQEAEKSIREILKIKTPGKIETKKKPIRLQPKKTEKQQELKPVKKEIPKSQLLDEINNFFNTNKINIIEETIKRKNSEIDFVIEVPSSVGKLKYFCKAKSKKTVNDGDLSSAFIQSQSKKLPCIFLIKGKLTKKAEEMLETEFKGMSVKKI